MLKEVRKAIFVLSISSIPVSLSLLNTGEQARVIVGWAMLAGCFLVLWILDRSMTNA